MNSYSFRIMGALPGHSPVEFFRAARVYSQADWNFHTRDLDRAWTCWVEYRTPDKRTLTPRIRTHTRQGTTPIKLKVTQL